MISKGHVTAKTAPVAPTEVAAGSVLSVILAGVFGAFLGLLLLKFGNPPIMEEEVTQPKEIFQFLFGFPWPITWAYWLLGGIGVVALAAAHWRRSAPIWLLALPLAWFVWQIFAATGSLNPHLSEITVKHFAATVCCFYFGYFSMGRWERAWTFWVGILVCFLVMTLIGVDQHFGGLEDTRHHIALYPQSPDASPAFRQKIASERIFATLFYPNVLAGAVLLFLPPLLAAVWGLRDRLAAASKGFRLGVLVVFVLSAMMLYVSGSRVGWIYLLVFGVATLRPAPKWFLAALVAAPALGCLFWSGSKGGWLLMLLLGVVALFRLPFGRTFKLALLTCVLAAGLAGFFYKYSGFFRKGATSVSARFDYWRAAIQTARERPFLGTGPGTFAIAYAKLKKPESEMARLTHNDYLEQASDSGVPGAVFYALFIVGALIWSFRSAFPPKAGAFLAKAGEPNRISASEPDSWQVFAVWLGVLGFGAQGLMEFGLYIPALAWPAFAFLGRLLSVPRSTPPDIQRKT
jgi:hypothetical protein